MSSTQIDVVVVITPAADKAERIVGLLHDVINYVEKNEPRTLRYQLIRSKNSQSGLEELIMVETYADQAAQDFHRTSEPYQALFAAVKTESLAHPEFPVQLKIGKAAAGFGHRL